MKKTKQVPIYEFDELEKAAQDQAICDHIEFVIETDDGETSTFYDDCIKEMEDLRTPWFLGQCIFDKHWFAIAELLQDNDYYFYQDGRAVPSELCPDDDSCEANYHSYRLRNGISLTSKPDYDMLPAGCMIGLRSYLEEGIAPGHFLYSVLCNDLVGAFQYADKTNRRRMADIISFLWNHIPMSAWGTPEKVDTWLKSFSWTY